MWSRARQLLARAAALAAGPVAWFGAGLTVAAGCFLGYTLVLAPPVAARVELPPRPALTPPAALPAALPAAPPSGPSGSPPPAITAGPSPRSGAATPVCPPVRGGPRLDLNAASAADLQALPGIGPTAAQKIVEHRQQAAFTSVQELRDLHLVSALTFSRIRDLVQVRAD